MVPFTVMLIDDEPWSLVALEKSIDFDGQGFEIICKADNPLDALEFLTKHRVDLVLTDIKMPQMSGIEFIGKARAQGVASEFAVVSGFADFDYAVNALRNNAADYLIKPIDPRKADEFIQKMRQTLFHKKVSSDLDTIEKLKSGQLHPKTFFDSQAFTILYPLFCGIIIDGAINGLPDVYGLRLCLGNNCEFLLGNLQSEEKYYALTTSTPEAGVRISFSSLYGGADQFLACLSEATRTYYNKMIFPDNVIQLPRRIHHREMAEFLTQIHSCLEMANMLEITRLIGSMKERTLLGDFVFSDLLFFYNQLSALLHRVSPDAPEIYDFMHMSAEELYNRYPSVENYWQVIQDTLEEIVTNTKSRREKSSAGSAFSSLLQYVDTHFEKDLYLKDLAKMFFINFTYCCELFKKTTGCTFSQYITNLRMEKAAELLALGGQSIEEIAGAVGYHDYYYFNNVFKKHFGITPYKYRKSKQ